MHNTRLSHLRHDRSALGKWLIRTGWFVLLWAAGVACVGAVGYAIRSAIL
ncbi:hypothetical protein AQS8620_01687 [Aquimixticola soesokkakensis]|uniref:DUF2474 domain-containing protein n=1 Tax=Aquimixticola soesokkakensis TaxID=1519096 RepID=A0A1Y5SPF4_9RHOB|nr:hypothetical protein [Aquimixticola soesokkakensis]SLN42339.1 hypothetical protein AQS8620_01687 [Aquimixticola soesokkakensis]